MLPAPCCTSTKAYDESGKLWQPIVGSRCDGIPASSVRSKSVAVHRSVAPMSFSSSASEGVQPVAAGLYTPHVSLSRPGAFIPCLLSSTTRSTRLPSAAPMFDSRITPLITARLSLMTRQSKLALIDNPVIDELPLGLSDRKSTRLNSSVYVISPMTVLLF